MVYFSNVLPQRYLFAAIGNGFRLYDVLAHEGNEHHSVIYLPAQQPSLILSDGHGHPKPLASHSNAHKKPITCLEFLEDRYDVSYTIESRRDGGRGCDSLNCIPHLIEHKRENQVD